MAGVVVVEQLLGQVEHALAGLDEVAQGERVELGERHEWYDFQTNPRGAVHVLTSVDNTSYTGSTMGGDHPTTWCQNYDGGRSFYTALGHTAESCTETAFLHIPLGGILITAGAATVISLRARADNRYVTAENGGGSPLIANRTAIGPWAQFDLIG
ncbi:ThuA domain-containing protein [Dactylosporangium sp. NPDC050588]|uniref:ThuA domain-containing protein n=1 Tax=Dactylosporangium sp. NPDC050588 TaxID=3157211 RepID=UPI0033F244E1